MEQNKAIYRKYRPNNFNDVAGHKNVVQILKNELQNNKLSHSFLFAGQRGTGKTSIARILAKSVNCLNLVNGISCDTCQSCLASNNQNNPDIIEMDAASNNGVDEIREIKNSVNTLPLLGKYKIYIIDEVHMLTKSAFNALLKTLEEPPVHAIFILATTEYAKIPATILSRCQIFNFKKIDRVSLTERINFIANNEGYKIEKEALEEIYILSEGSLRDASNTLEQLMTIAEAEIKAEDLKSIFYIATKIEKLEIIKNIVNKNADQIIKYFESANNQAMDFDVFTLSLIEIVKEIIEYKYTRSSEFLNILEESDISDILNISNKTLFSIADGLSEAYSKTKGSNISFNYLLISILKRIDLNDEVFLPNESIDFEKQENIEVVKIVKELEVINEPVQTVQVSEPVETPKIIESVVTLNNEESIEKEKSILTLTSLEIELAKRITNSENKDTYKVEVEEVINLLVGANKAKREEIELKIFNIFKNENGKLISSDKAKSFIDLYGLKVVAASENEVLLRSEDYLNIHNLLNSMKDETFRNNLIKEFGNILFLPIDSNTWNQTKILFKKLKDNDQLPAYKKVDQSEYFVTKNKMLLLKNLDEKTIEAATQLFDINDIKIED